MARKGVKSGSNQYFLLSSTIPSKKNFYDPASFTSKKYFERLNNNSWNWLKQMAGAEKSLIPDSAMYGFFSIPESK